jgi:hypothetical protein
VVLRYNEARAEPVHFQVVHARCLRWPSDIWPRHYIGGLTGIFKPDSGNFRRGIARSSPISSRYEGFVGR